MKSIFRYILVFTSLSIVISACVEEDKIRYELGDFERAVNLRITSSVSTFDATNDDASTTLTFYSENNDEIEKVDLFIDHYIFLEDSTSDKESLLTMNGSQITNDGSTTVTFTLSELASAIGINQEDLAGGDILTIHNITTMKNGEVYPDTVLTGTEFETTNVAPSIAQSASTTSFTSTVTFPIVCELPEGFGTGEYLFELVEGSNSAFGGAIFDDNTIVNLEATSNTGRTFNVGYFSDFGFDQDVTFDFACNITLVPPTDTGLGCPSPTIVYTIDSSDPGTFDITDDSQFTIGILHNTSGGCGLPVGERYLIRLTKQ